MLLVVLLGLVIFLEYRRKEMQYKKFFDMIKDQSNGSNDYYSRKALKKFETTVAQKSNKAEDYLYGGMMYDLNFEQADTAIDTYLKAIELSTDKDVRFMALNKLQECVSRKEEGLTEEIKKRLEEYEFNAITKYKDDVVRNEVVQENDGQERINDYWNPQILADPQNVHDYSVYNDLNKKLDYLKKMYKDDFLSERETIDSINRYLDNVRTTENNRDIRRVKKLLRKFSSNNIIKGFQSDMYVLQMVWTRAMKTQNDSLKEIIVSMLEESMNDRGEITCLMGRCTRLLDSMTVVDEDENLNGSVQSSGMIRQEIFSKAKDILDRQLELFKEEVPVESEQYDSYSSFVNRYKIGDIFKDDEPEKNIEKKFLSQLKIKLEYLLDIYKDKLSEPTLRLIQKEIEIGYGLFD